VNPLWDYFWPIFAAGSVIGAFSGHLAFRQMQINRRNQLGKDGPQGMVWRRIRKVYFGSGALIAVLATLLWSGPLGGGDRLTKRIESAARATLDHLEMTQVTARLQRSPLRRRLILSGPADDFQRSQLVQILDDIHGVAGVRWANSPNPSAGAK
jgi:hypothetical protein